MESDEKRRGKEVLSGGHLCHVCGYQYPNPNPSAKLRRSHRKNCRKSLAEDGAGAEGGGVEVDEQEEASGEHSAGKEPLLGEEGGEGEGNGASKANGGSTLRGSAREDGDLAEDKENSEHGSPNGTGVQVITSECSENGLINCINISFQIANEGNGTNLPMACANGSQSEVAEHCSGIAPLAVGHLAEREDSFDDYQDASPFLHQSDSEDGAALNSEFSIEEIKNSNIVLLGPSVAANEISLETHGLCNDHSREPSMTDLSADSNVGKEVGYYFESRIPGLDGTEVSLKLHGPDECSVSVNSNDTDMIDSKSDKTSGHCELIGDWNASSLQKTSFVSDMESQSTCSRKVENFMEDSVDVLHTMPEASPRPEVIESDNVESETVADSSTNFMPTGDELKFIHTENTSEDFSTESLSQNKSVEDTSDVQLSVENSCQENSVGSTVGYQNDFAVTNVDGMLSSIAADKCNEGIITKSSELDFSFQEKLQPDVEPSTNMAEENPSIDKRNGFPKGQICNEEINPEVPSGPPNSKDKVSTTTSEEPFTLLVDQASCIKNPVNLDDTRSDDLFELATDSCHLEESNVAESKQQVDSTTSLAVDQLSVSDPTSIAERQHCLISDNCKLAVSNTSENGPAVGADGVYVSSSADLTKSISLPDASVDCSRQEDESRTSGVVFVPSQVDPAGISTAPMFWEINALSTDVEEKMQTEDTSAKEMAAVHGVDNVEGKKQIKDTSVKDMNAVLSADSVEAKKLIEDTSAEMNAVCHSDNVEGKKQAEETSTKEVNSVQSAENVEEKKQAEDTGAKEMNAEFNADNVEETKQTDDTSAKDMNAAQHTDDVEEKKNVEDTSAKDMNAVQSIDNVDEETTEDALGQQGTKQNEEIAVMGVRLNSERIHVPLKVLLAEASVETKEKKTSTKDRVLSFRRRVSKEDAKSGSPKAGSDDQYWNSPAKLPQSNDDRRPKGRKQPWMPFICCHSVH